MICGTFMSDDLIMWFFVDARQQDEADRAEQDKAKKLSKPKQPAQGEAEGDGRNMVEGDGFLDEQGVGADAAGGNDHADTAHREDAERVDDGEVAGGADGEESEPGA